MIRVLIVDDEAPARAKLQRWLAEQTAFTVIGEADNGLSAAETIVQQQPDLVLLDIQMPGLSGLEVAAQIDVTPAPLIVFVTAFDDHAIKAFELNAVDYLLKPYDKDRLLRTLNRVQQRLQTRSTPTNAASADASNANANANAANSNKTDSNTAESRTTESNNGIDSARHTARALQQQQGPLNRLLVPVGEGLQLLDVDRIHWCQADDNYLHLHTDTARYTLRRTLQDLLSQLDPRQFVRVHKSAAVNLREILRLEPLFKGDYDIVLRSGMTVRMSRRYNDELLRLLGK